jgi:MFS family permease
MQMDRQNAQVSVKVTALAYYALIILMFAVFLSFLDRMILSLVIGPVRHDLHISDTQISLLIGGVFAVFYVLTAVPFGWLVDRTNRRNLLAVAMIFWGGMTVLSGFTTSFTELGLTRIGLALGEAALMPAAMSMIGDLFPTHLRGRATGAYTAAGVFGVGGAYVLGGLVLKAFQGVDVVSLPVIGNMALWQAAFVVVGLPTILLGLITFALPEPPRSRSQLTPSKEPSASLIAYVKTNRKAFFYVYGNYIFVTLVAYAWLTWLPTFFIRKYAMTPATAGLSVGVVTLVAGVLGSIAGGALGDRWTVKGVRGGRFTLNMIMWATVPVLALCLLINNFYLSLACAGVFFFVDYVAYGSYGAVIQDMVPPPLRGQAVVLWYLITGLIGIGLGPVSIAVATQYLFGGDAGLPYAMAFVPLPSVVLGAILCWFGRNAFDDTRRQVDREAMAGAGTGRMSAPPPPGGT